MSIINDLKALKKRLQAIKVNKLLHIIYNELQNNSEYFSKESTERLYNTGIDKDNNIIRTNQAIRQVNKGKSKTYNNLGKVYSGTTNKIKRSKGQKISNVTFKDTGEYYDSVGIKIIKDGVEIIADNKKLSIIIDNFSSTYKNIDELREKTLFLSDIQLDKLSKICLNRLNELINVQMPQ